MKATRKPRKLSATLSGVAGEYLVAGELTRRGYVASLTLRNTRGIDILASDQDATKSVGIQVKTIQGGSRKWMLTKKSIEARTAAKNLVFVLVRLPRSGPAEFHVVPRSVVTRFAKRGHARWLETPRRDGKPHKDTPIRTFLDPDDKYLNRWDLLELD